MYTICTGNRKKGFGLYDYFRISDFGKVTTVGVWFMLENFKEMHFVKVTFSWVGWSNIAMNDAQSDFDVKEK